MKRLLPILILLIASVACPAPAHAAPCSSNAGASLGNNWSIVDGCSYYGLGGATYTESLVASGSENIEVGDVLIVCVDSASTGALSDTLKITDNADSIQYTDWPPGTQSQGLDAANTPYSCATHIATVAKSSGYQVTVTWASGTTHVNDFVWAQFRNSSGTSQGMETANGSGATSGFSVQYTSNATAASGTCPCVAFNGSITTKVSGDLIIGVGNMSNSSDTVPTSGWTSVDEAPGSGDGGNDSCSFPGDGPFCFMQARSQTSAGAQAWEWTDTNANDPYLSGLFAFEPPSGGGSGSTPAFDKRRKLEKLDR